MQALRWRAAGGAWSPDVAAVLVLVAGLVYGEWDVITGTPILGMDTATAFYPWYGFLGQSLRAGTLPGWNPHQFSGTPFAADPESGWMYLPAMVLFSLFALPVAAKGFIVLHVLLAGTFTYALARTLGASLAGATLAGATYALSGFLYGHGMCCFAYASVAVWLPLVVLGTERAVRSDTWLHRWLWWAAAGLGLSQIFAAWLGQGAYYAVLVWAAYLLYRTLLAPVPTTASPRTRIRQLLVHGAATILCATCLAAAGLLPRLEYNAVSNLPGGYPNAAPSTPASVMDWGFVRDWDVMLLTPSFYYAGITTVALALAAPVVAGRRTGVAVFAVLGLAVLVLSRLEPTPLHWLLATLPSYERLTNRSPERALIAFYLPCSLLAGATLTWLSQLDRLRRVRHLLGCVVVIAVVQLDLHPADRSVLAQALHGDAAYDLQRLDLATYYAPPPSIQFLQSQAADGAFRYFGYAQHVYGGPIPYTLRWAEPRTAALGVNNLALVSGLYDVQGYNPIHVARYDEFLAAVNGRGQDYHHANVLDAGLNSRLLDLLNVRFVIVPTVTASDELPPHFERGFPLVYADADVTIFENPDALPRFRLVHAAIQVPSGQALAKLDSDGFDPRRTTVLEETLPVLSQPDSAAAELVETKVYGSNEIGIATRTAAPGLLVLSEVSYPAWQAYVDGRPVHLYVADHAFRAVPVPAGSHSIQLRYESGWLLAGTLVSVGAYVVLLSGVIAAGRQRLTTWITRPRPKVSPRNANNPPTNGT
jgi:hypothetical protein